MEDHFVWINDELVPASKASLGITDLAIQRGYAVFDFLKTLNGRPVFIDDHLDRLFRSAERMRLEVGSTQSELRDMITQLMWKNGLPDSGIRLTLTGGYASDSYSVTRPNLVISQHPLTTVPTPELPLPIRLVSYPHIRQLPNIKTIDYLMAIWLQPFVRAQGADDVLYHLNGAITECPRSNIFMVTGSDTLVTPSQNILHGVMRGKVLELARSQFTVEERDMTLDQLRTAKEVFITSTTKHIWPVVQVDGEKIGKGVAGPVAQALNLELYQLVKNGG